MIDTICGNHLNSLRWKEDTVIENYDGERVWLKQTAVYRRDGTLQYIGITDCCLVGHPCAWHMALALADTTKN